MSLKLRPECYNNMVSGDMIKINALTAGYEGDLYWGDNFWSSSIHLPTGLTHEIDKIWKDRKLQMVSEPELEFEERAGVKYDEMKLRMDLIEWGPMRELARILTQGAKKYADRNWQKLDPSRIEAALLRHFSARAEGQ